jgi:cytochrome d ubiquinol oxidase subunit II
MESYLAVVWGLLLGLAIVMYVILDGFDLGIGILFPTTRIEAERDQMMNTIAPFWDGNETWLVLGGGGLLVAFPLAYSILMPALHVPILVMLLGLVLRGVAFEFRWVAKPYHHWWDRAFFGALRLRASLRAVCWVVCCRA